MKRGVPAKGRFHRMRREVANQYSSQFFKTAREKFKRARTLAEEAFMAIADAESMMHTTDRERWPLSESDYRHFEGLRYAKHNLGMTITVLNTILGPEDDE